MPLILNMLCAATGLEMDEGEACNVGLRALNLMRAVKLRRGRGEDTYLLSARYGSAIPDGADAGKSIQPVFTDMRRRYYLGMGWDPTDGRPLPETLRRLSLEPVVAGLWPES